MPHKTWVGTKWTVFVFSSIYHSVHSHTDDAATETVMSSNCLLCLPNTQFIITQCDKAANGHSWKAGITITVIFCQSAATWLILWGHRSVLPHVEEQCLFHLCAMFWSPKMGTSSFSSKTTMSCNQDKERQTTTHLRSLANFKNTLSTRAIRGTGRKDGARGIHSQFVPDRWYGQRILIQLRPRKNQQEPHSLYPTCCVSSVLLSSTITCTILLKVSINIKQIYFLWYYLLPYTQCHVAASTF